MLPISNPVGSLAMQVENFSCGGPGWRIMADASWLTPNVLTGTTAGTALFTVNATGMYTGFYASEMTIYATSSQWFWPWAISRTITARLWLVDAVHHSYLPVVTRGD